MRRMLTMVTLAGLALAGCSSTKLVTKPEATTTSTTAAAAHPGSSTTAAPATTTTAAPQVAHVGDAVHLNATDTTAPVDLTLVKVVDPAQGSDEFNTPDAGKRFVGAQIKVVLGGSQPEQASLDSDLTLFDSQGQSYQSDLSTLANCQAFAAALTLQPGVPALGCIAFQVPTGATITRVQFSPSLGLAGVTAQWQVP